MSVLLLSHVDRLTVELERLYEVARRVVILHRLLQIRESILKLPQHQLSRHRWLYLLWQLCLQNAHPELRNHEQLLNKTVHVARAAEVAQTHVTRC